MAQKKRTHSPDPRKSPDRPGVKVTMRLGDEALEKLAYWRRNLTIPQAIRLALEEKYLRSSR